MELVVIMLKWSLKDWLRLFRLGADECEESVYD